MRKTLKLVLPPSDVENLHLCAQQATVTFAAVLGDVEAGDDHAFRVAEGFPAADPLSAQMRALVDDIAARFSQKIRPMLIAANTRQAF